LCEHLPENTVDLSHQITTPASQVSAFTEQYNSIGNLLPIFRLSCGCCCRSLAWGSRRRERDFALVSRGGFLIFLASQWFQAAW
jgi:hypothetical protein